MELWHIGAASGSLSEINAIADRDRGPGGDNPPGHLGVIIDVLRFASERTQLIVTTHSPEVLDADWLEDRHIRMVTWQDGATRVTPLSVGSRDALRGHRQRR